MATVELMSITAAEHIRRFEVALKDLPNMGETSAYAHEKPFLDLIRLFARYRKVVRRLVSLSTEELKKIMEINNGLKKEGANTFLDKLRPKQKDQLITIVTEVSDPNSPDYQNALDDLKRMMEKAKKLKDEGKAPSDENSEFNDAIYGYLEITDPRAQEHFLMCHLIERFLTQVLKKIDPSLSLRKDYFLTALTDIVIFDGIRHKDSEIFLTWRTKKPDGLGWVGKERLDAHIARRIDEFCKLAGKWEKFNSAAREISDHPVWIEWAKSTVNIEPRTLARKLASDILAYHEQNTITSLAVE